MIRPRLLAAIVVWVVVVAGASTLVWAVISRAGQQVVSADQQVPATTGSAVRHPASRATRSPSGTHASSSAPTSSAGSTSGSTSGSPAPPPTPVERRSWQGQGGLLVAECVGPTVSLVSTQPQVGFHAEVKKGGPEELEVEFDGREDDAGTNVTVTARCVDGVPVFTSRLEGGDD